MTDASKRLPTVGEVRLILNRYQLRQRLPDWSSNRLCLVAVLHEPKSFVQDDWLVLSAALVARWGYPAETLQQAVHWGFSRLRKSMPLAPRAAQTDTPLEAHQGIWLTYCGTPAAYLTSTLAYQAWHHTKLQVA